MNARLYLTTLPWESCQTCSRMIPFSESPLALYSSTTFPGLHLFFTGFTMISQLGHEMTRLFGSYGANQSDIHVK